MAPPKEGGKDFREKYKDGEVALRGGSKGMSTAEAEEVVYEGQVRGKT